MSTPESYVDPSNLISKSVVSEIESLFKDVNITNPNRIYPDFNEVISLINNLPSLDDINNDNYLSYQEKVDEVINKYNGLNIDDRDVFYEEEYYHIRVKNKTSNTIVLADTQEMKEVLLQVGSEKRSCNNDKFSTPSNSSAMKLGICFERLHSLQNKFSIIISIYLPTFLRFSAPPFYYFYARIQK